MKIKTFYSLFYRHRINKASFLRKLYLLIIIIPIKYLINYFYFEKKINLDKLHVDEKLLFDKDLNYLFEYFNSDKGEIFTDQYMQPSKKKHEYNTSTWVFKIL